MPQAFWSLDHKILRHFYESSQPRLFHGKRLLAVDGSTLRLSGVSTQCAAYFDPKAQKRGDTSLIRWSCCYDILNGLCCDSTIAPHHTSEQALIFGHLDVCGSSDVLVMDRNYASFRLCRHLQNIDLAFVARFKVKQFTSLLGDFLESDEQERILLWSPSSRQKRQCETLEIDPSPLTVRLVKVLLITGEVEVLITNLDVEDGWDLKRLAEVYRLRWCVEEGFKLYKSRAQIERWSGKSVTAVEQDFYARVLLANISTLLSNGAQRIIQRSSRHCRQRHQLNRTHALCETRNVLLELLKCSNLIQSLRELRTMFLQNPCPIRPGRIFPRIFKPRSDFAFAYKALA